jgi:5-methylcytosine-specific restriction endonuclease McrA
MNAITFRRRDRREFPRKVKVIAFNRCHGTCEGPCGRPLVTGHIIYDHRIPWEISRDSSVDNCQALCDICDGIKTPADQSTIAKSNRIRDKHIGAAPVSRNPLPGSRKSPFKLKIGGGAVSRATGEPWRWGR